MTEAQADRLAAVLVGAAAAGVLYYVLKTPPLRRAAWQLVRTAIAAAGPWVSAEARAAWVESARHRGDAGVHDARGPGAG